MATLYEILTAAGFPIESASNEAGVKLLPGAELTLTEQLRLGEAILEYQDPAGYADYLAYKQLKQQWKDEYQNTITRLEQIQTASNPTNAQVVQAIKDEALYLERMMKFLQRLLT